MKVTIVSLLDFNGIVASPSTSTLGVLCHTGELVAPIFDQICIEGVVFRPAEPSSPSVTSTSRPPRLNLLVGASLADSSSLSKCRILRRSTTLAPDCTSLKTCLETNTASRTPPLDPRFPFGIYHINSMAWALVFERRFADFFA